jgi:threonyl-tRNA synthetase
VDYNLPERFELEYTGKDNQSHRPVMIHRAPFGSMERFMSILIEHTAGKFPLWLTPEPFTVLTLSENFGAYAKEVLAELSALGYSGLLDDRAESIGRKIRDAELKKIPYMLIVGEKEKENREISVRKLGKIDLGSMGLKTFAQHLQEAIERGE